MKAIRKWGITSADGSLETTVTTRENLNFHDTEDEAQEHIDWWKSCNGDITGMKPIEVVIMPLEPEAKK